MAFLDALDVLTPQTNVNKGAAFVPKPLYPELIGMMQEHKKQEFKDKQFAQKRLADNLDWFDKGKVDTSKLDAHNALIVNDAYSEVWKENIRMLNAGGSPQTDELIRAKLQDVTNMAHQMAASKNEKTVLLNEHGVGGRYEHVNSSKTVELMRQEEDRARVAVLAKLRGEEYEGSLVADYKGIYNNPATFRHKFMDKQVYAEYDKNRKNQFIEERKSGRTDIYNVSYANLDIYETDDKGNVILDKKTKRPTIKSLDDKSGAWDVHLEDIRVNNSKYFKSLKWRADELNRNGVKINEDGEDRDVHVGDVALKAFKDSVGGATRIELVKTITDPAPKGLSGPEAVAADIEKFVYNMQYALSTGNKAEFGRIAKSASNANFKVSTGVDVVPDISKGESRNDKGIVIDAAGNEIKDRKEDVVRINIRKSYLLNDNFLKLLEGDAELAEAMSNRKDLEGGEYTQVLIPYNAENRDVVINVLAQIGYTNKHKNLALQASTRAIRDAREHLEKGGDADDL